MLFKSMLKEKNYNYTSLARAVGVTPQAVKMWAIRGVPPCRVLIVSRLTGISKTILRPDLYPEEKDK